MESTPLDSKKAGVRNERLILKRLREQGPLSQKQLCQGTVLGSSTASAIVSRLRDKGLIQETQGTSTSRGPKPVMLRINPQGRYLVGAEINPSYLRIGLFDFMVDSITQTEIPLKSTAAASVVELLAVNVLGLLSKHGINADCVEGLGVTVSGSVSWDGVVELSSTLGWKQVPLCDLLSRDLHFPIRIFTTRVRLLAEMSLISDPPPHHVLYVNIADGVGANAIIDNHLIHGTSYRAGEIGHIVVDPKGPQCGCGHIGCLEAFVSGPALVQRIRHDLGQGQNSMLTSLITEQDNHRTVIYKWGQAVAKKDTYALTLQDFVTQHLSKALAVAINLYDPQLLILAGYVSEACYDALTTAVTTILKTQVYDGDTRTIAIHAAQAGPLRYTKGAAIAVLTDET